nr:hypothetical protein [Treponema denticola]
MASKPDKQITRTTAIGAAQRIMCIARKRLGQKMSSIRQPKENQKDKSYLQGA